MSTRIEYAVEVPEIGWLASDSGGQMTVSDEALIYHGTEVVEHAARRLSGQYRKLGMSATAASIKIVARRVTVAVSEWDDGYLLPESARES
jgi:hypothetical protein